MKILNNTIKNSNLSIADCGLYVNNYFSLIPDLTFYYWSSLYHLSIEYETTH